MGVLNRKQKIRRFQLSTTVLLVLCTFPIHAATDESPVPETRWEKCKPGFEKIVHNVGAYLKEVNESPYYSRILLKDVPENDPHRALLGFLVEYEPPAVHRWYQWPGYLVRYPSRRVTEWLWGAPYELQVVDGVYHNLFRRPTRWVTGRFGKRKDPTYVVSIPSSFMIGAIGYGVYRWQLDKAFQRKVKAEVEEDAAFWDALLESDYRYHDLREKREKGLLTPEQARLEAFARYKVLESYYVYMENLWALETPEQRREFLLEHPLFNNVAEIARNGVPAGQAGFVYQQGFQAQPTTEQIDDLLTLQQLLFDVQQAIPKVLEDPASVGQLPAGSEARKILEAMQQDPYFGFLTDLRKEGKISKEQYQYRVQQDAHWRFQLAQFKVLKIGLKKEGGADGEATTLQDIRLKMVDDLRREVESKK